MDLSRPKRRLSIDVLRGLTVAFMILVNNAGDGEASYPQLRHSVWSGCTLTDLVFPLFLFIMGVSMVISFESRIAKGVARAELARQILRRSATLILIGLCINALPVPHLSSLRYCGVLQRIGLCYLLAGGALLCLRFKGMVILTVSLIIGYWVLLVVIPVPGFGRPGLDVPILDAHGNLASYVDRLLIPEAHRYHFSFYDPEGILSTLPATGTTCLGILAGLWTIRRGLSLVGKRLGMLAAGAALICAGLAWNHYFPFNKRLWTSSYVLFAGGISMVLLGVFEWIFDDSPLAQSRPVKRGLEPFLAFGANALTAYIFSEVLGIVIGAIPAPGYGTLQRLTFLLIPNALGTTAFRSVLWSILFVGVCFLPAFWLRRRGIVVKI